MKERFQYQWILSIKLTNVVLSLFVTIKHRICCLKIKTVNTNLGLRKIKSQLNKQTMYQTAVYKLGSDWSNRQMQWSGGISRTIIVFSYRDSDLAPSSLSTFAESTRYWQTEKHCAILFGQKSLTFKRKFWFSLFWLFKKSWPDIGGSEYVRSGLERVYCIMRFYIFNWLVF